PTGGADNKDNLEDNKVKKTRIPKWVLPKNWFIFLNLFSFRWKLVILFLVFLILGYFVFWIGHAYLSWTKQVPRDGGHYIEGVIGQPAYINPLLSQTSEADADLVQLVYSGLFKYNKEGKIIKDIAEKYEISEDKKTYKVYLRKDIKWHDGETLDASDIHFTVSILKDKSYKSPLRFNWQGVEVNQIDDYTLEFILKEPYFGFIDNLTVGILPKHIWENITAEKFVLADYNLRPVGSGPYKFFDFQKDSDGNILTYELRAFQEYYEGRPHISRITFNFYFNEDSNSIIDDFNKKEILGMSSIAPEKIEDVKTIKSTKFYEVNIPRYFSVFFNITRSIPLANDEVRKSLAYATDRHDIITRVLDGKGAEIYSLFLPGTEECSEDFEKYNFDIDRANSILEESGWKKGENGVREKDGVKLEFTLHTTDWPKLSQTADILREQWEKIGAKVNVNVLTAFDLEQNHIRPREYEALLLGQYNNFNSDPYSFWHSSQKRDPGLNFSVFENKDVDELLSGAREDLDRETRVEKYKQFQKIIAEEIPAIFLYSSHYIYPVNKKVKGIDIQSVNSP
ncbi:MAG TPA: hypothetical protein ENG89_00405, partial [Candidatus Moranbacteria bacterium]|nr:hypothetical protein [Candidatus Moranbacteria bacterium]